MRPVAIYGGQRLPFARQNTAHATSGNLPMSVAVLDAIAAKYGLAGAELGEVALGAVIHHSRDWNLAREAVLDSVLKHTTPGLTMTRACGTSLDTVVTVADRISAGRIEAGIGGGSDTASEAPIVASRRLNERLLAVSRARSFGGRVGTFLRGFRPSELKPDLPAVREPRTGRSMGEHTETMAQAWGIARADQDLLAFNSHQNAAAAYARGFHADLVIPFNGLERDNLLRPDTSLEKLAKLPPAFDRDSGRGTLTAGNSTPLTDGAAAVLLGSEEWGRQRGLQPWAYLVDAEVAAVDFLGGGEGLLMAPTIAIARLLKRRGLRFADFELFEIHEAFAAQVLCTLKAFMDDTYCRERLGLPAPLGPIPVEKLNPIGSSLAYGHPFAATGARIVAAAAKQLKERGQGRALVSICTAGGMGVVAVLER